MGYTSEYISRLVAQHCIANMHAIQWTIYTQMTNCTMPCDEKMGYNYYTMQWFYCVNP